MNGDLILDLFPELAERRLTPSELAVLSGVPTDKQRLWRDRGHVTFEFAPGWIAANPAARRTHNEFNWSVATQWSLLNELVQAGFPVGAVSKLVRSERVQSLCSNNFAFREGLPDLVILVRLSSGSDDDWDAPTTSNLGSVPFANPEPPGQSPWWDVPTVVINFSAFQRRLLERYAEHFA